MKRYQFKDIENVFVTGDCHGEFKSFFNGIKNNLIIKKEDEETTHPMEIERQARKKAKKDAENEMAWRNLRRDGGGIFARPGRIAPNQYERFEMTTEQISANTAEMLKKIKYGTSYSSGGMFNNSIIIVAGDCGFGFNKEKYYEDILVKFNKILSYNNAVLAFVRGNHDDPQYFDGEKVNYSNIIAVPDYSIIETKNRTILCVGGAVSTDRTWRKEQEDRINRFRPTNKKRLYWEDEAPALKTDELREVVNTIDKPIDFVISHSAPSFATPVEHSGLQEWCEKDKTLKEDVTNERLVMDRIFEYLRDSGKKPKYWAYGHFDTISLEKRSETIFRALSDGFNPINIDNEISMFMASESMSKKKSKKGKKPLKANSRFHPINELRGINPVAIDNPFDEGTEIANAGEPEEFIEDELVANDGGEEMLVEQEPLLDGIADEVAGEQDHAYDNAEQRLDDIRVEIERQNDNGRVWERLEAPANVWNIPNYRFDNGHIVIDYDANIGNLEHNNGGEFATVFNGINVNDAATITTTVATNGTVANAAAADQVIDNAIG